MASTQTKQLGSLLDTSAYTSLGKFKLEVSDYHGKLVYAFSIFLGLGTNNTFEIKKALKGSSSCDQHGQKRVMIKV